MSEIETVYPIQLADRTGLVCINRAELKDVLLSAGALDPLVASIREMAKNLIADPLTADGRKQIREMGEKLNRIHKDKGALDKLRLGIVVPLKEEPKTIDENVREARNAIKAIEEEVTAQMREIDARAEKLRLMAERPNILTAAPAKELRVELAQAEVMDVSPSIWHESADTAIAVKAGLIDALSTMLEKRVETERQQAEFEAFQRKQAEEKRLREIDEAREQGRKEAEEKAIAEAQRKAQAVTETVAEIVAPVKVAQIPHDDDFDSDYHKIDRFLMRIQAVTIPVLRDAGNQSRIASIINRAVSAIKGI